MSGERSGRLFTKELESEVGYNLMFATGIHFIAIHKPEEKHRMVAGRLPMRVRQTFVLVATLFLCAAIPNRTAFRGTALASPVHSGAQLNAVAGATQHPSTSTTSTSAGPLGEQSKIEIIRNVSGEYAKVVLALPRGKEGFTYRLGQALDTARLHDMVRTRGAAVNTGDTAQITAIEFHPKAIVFLINGGGKRHFHLREHLEIGIGGSTAPVGSTPHPGEGTGATLVMDYGHPLPEMSPDDLKAQLSPILDFSKQTSATTNWIDTVPPEFQEAIKNHQAAVGMDEEMVIAALGRPEKKVRERDQNGNDTEDWIYGTPPAKTTFVTFAAGKVTRVQEFD